MVCRYTVVLILCLCIVGTIDNYRMDLVPERPAVTYVNKKYLDYVKFYLTRFGRKSVYYANIEAGVKYPLGNNVTIDIVFYERLGNEYKRSFVEFKKPLCDLVNLDPYLGKMLRDIGVKCPLPRAELHLMNMTLLNIPMPYKWPFTKAKVEATVCTLANETVVSGYSYFSIKLKN